MQLLTDKQMTKQDQLDMTIKQGYATDTNSQDQTAETTPLDD
jgi:hypothetical protein